MLGVVAAGAVAVPTQVGTGVGTGVGTASSGDPSCGFPRVRLVMPVAGRLGAPFVAPRCPYCPGRRGVIIDSREGAAVVASASGEVTFAGQVAGVLWVVVQASPRVRLSHGRLAQITGPGGIPVQAGHHVRAGDPIGVAGPTTYLGATSAGVAVDPWPALSGRIHLVPPGGVSVGCATPRAATPSGSRPPPR